MMTELERLVQEHPEFGHRLQSEECLSERCYGNEFLIPLVTDVSTRHPHIDRHKLEDCMTPDDRGDVFSKAKTYGEAAMVLYRRHQREIDEMFSDCCSDSGCCLK